MVLQVPAGEETGPGRNQNLLKEEENEEDEEVMKEDDDEEEEVVGKRKYYEDMKDSLVVEGAWLTNSLLVPFAICLLPLQLLLNGFYQQEEV